MISDAIRKASGSPSAAVRSERPPSFRKLLHSLNAVEHFQEELIAQTLRLVVVILDRFVKLLLRNIEKPDFHHLP